MDEESSTGKKLIEIFKGLNIALFDQEGQIRSTYDILSDLAGKWQGLSKNEQEYIALTSAGANQLNNFLALMNGFNTALDANKVALNSAGSAVQENERYMDSLAAKVSQFKSAWEAFSNSVVNSDLVKFVIDFGTGTLKTLNTELGTTATQFALLTGVGTGALSLLGMFGKNLTKNIPYLQNMTKLFEGMATTSPLVSAGIAAITLAVAAGYSAWKKYHEAVYSTAEDLEKAIDKSNESFNESEKSIEATSRVAQQYAEKLEALDKQTGKTNQDIQEMSRLVDLLNGLFPDLGLTIDEATGKLNKQTQAITDQIDAWKKLAIQQAYSQRYQEQLSAYASADIEMREKQSSLTENRAKQEAVAKELEEAEAAYLRTVHSYENIYATTQAEELVSEKRAELRQLEKEEKTLLKSIDVTQKALDEADAQLAGLQDTLGELDTASKGSTLSTGSRLPNATTTKRSGAMAVEFGGGQVPGTSRAQEEPFYQFDYSDWLDKQKHALAMGEIQEADYYASLEFMLNKWTDENVISTKDRWRAEESIYQYKKQLSEQEQKDYENRLKAQQTASKTATTSSYDDAKAQATAYKQAFTDWLDEKNYLLNTDQITEQEYYDALKAKNEEYYGGKSEYLSEYRKYAETVYAWEKAQNEEVAKAAKQAHEDEFDSWLAKMDHALAMGEISEENYYERLKEMSDLYFKGNEEYLDKYWKYEEQYYSWKQKQIETAAEAEKKAQEDALNRQKEKLKLQQQELQAEQDNLNAVISYAQKYSQKQIDNIDERINKLKDEATAIQDNYQSQIDKLKETNDALDNQIEKQKLLEALAKAQQTKKYVFKDGRFQYVDDVDAITSAQEALDNFNRQQNLNDRIALLEKQRDAELASNDAAQKALEQQKQRWQDYKDGWANLTDDYEYNQNELLALERYGIDFEKATWDERIANLNDFKEKYAQNVKDLEKLATRLNNLETSGSSSSTVQVATKVDPDQAILDEMKANSQAWWFASTDKEREAIHRRNVELNEMLSNKGTYDPGSGKWSHYAKGTTSARGGLSLVGEKGAELRVLNKGDGVVPAHMTENLMDWGAQKPNEFVNKMLNKGKEVLSNVINVGNVSLPNVQNAKEFVSELKNLAYQAAYSRT